MEYICQYAWIIPFLPFPVPLLIGVGLLFFPKATKNFRRIWAFSSISLLSIVMNFLMTLSIQQLNNNYIYQYVWSWTINNDFSLEFGYLLDSLTSIIYIYILRCMFGWLAVPVPRAREDLVICALPRRS